MKDVVLCAVCGVEIPGASRRRMFCDSCIRDKNRERARRECSEDRLMRKGMSPDRPSMFYDHHVRVHVPVEAGWRGRPCCGARQFYSIVQLEPSLSR